MIAASRPVEDPQNSSEHPGQEPHDDDALGGAREQDDQTTDDGSIDPEKRRLRAEAKRLRLERNEFRDKLKTREDRDKTEVQTATERAEAAEQRLRVAEAKVLRSEVAAEHDLPPEAAQFLQGETREEFDANAKALAKLLGGDGNGRASAGIVGGVRRPVQRPKTMNDLIRQAAGR
jgi:hypothetical protein